MNKITFLNELEIELDDLPRNQKDQIMYKYETLFFNEEKKGKSEQQIVEKLETPQRIAKNFKAKSAISYAEIRPNLRNVMRAIMASLSLGLLSTLFVLIPTILVSILLIFVFMIALFLLLSPVIMIISSFIKSIPDSISNIFFAISYTGLGLILIVLITKLLDRIYRWVLKYLNWYIKTIKGSVQ